MSAVHVRLAADITQLKKELGAARAQLDRLKKQGGKNAKGFAADTTGAFGRVQAGITSLVKDFGLLKFAGVAGLGVLAHSAWDASREIEAATAQIQRDVGRVGPAAADVVNQFDDALGQLPNAVADIGSAVGTTDTLLGLSGDNLERYIVTLGKFSRITKSSMQTNADAVARYFRAFDVHASRYESALAALYTVTANTGVGVDVLLRALLQYGPTLRAVGFDAEDAALLFGELYAAGIQLEKLDEPLKSFAAKTAALGQDPKQALIDVVTEIENARTATEANAIAQEAFGTNFANITDIIREQGVPVVDLLTDAYNRQTLSVEKLYNETETLGEKQKSVWNDLKGFASDIDRMLGQVVAFGTWLGTPTDFEKSLFGNVPGAEPRTSQRTPRGRGRPDPEPRTSQRTPRGRGPKTEPVPFLAPKGGRVPVNIETPWAAIPTSHKERQAAERQAADREREQALALHGLQDRRYELGRIALDDYLNLLTDRIDYFGGMETERGLDVVKLINRLVTQSETKEDDHLYVQLQSDDKPDRIIRAQKGPIRSRPRGACG